MTRQAGGVKHNIWIGRNLVEGKKNIIKSVIFFHNQDFESLPVITAIVCCFDNNLKPLNASVNLCWPSGKKEKGTFCCNFQFGTYQHFWRKRINAFLKNAICNIYILGLDCIQPWSTLSNISYIYIVSWIHIYIYWRKKATYIYLRKYIPICIVKRNSTCYRKNSPLSGLYNQALAELES